MTSIASDRRNGLRPTRRHFGIAVCFVLLSWFGYACLCELRRQTGLIQPLAVSILYSPWLLGFLIILLDRRGPLRNWFAPMLISLFYPVMGFCYDWSAYSAWMRFGVSPSWGVLIPTNVVLVFGFAFFLLQMYPRRCPRCEQRSLIPLLRLFVQEKRSAKTHWCASCGEKLWKDREGHWQKERRWTWLDAEEIKSIRAGEARTGRVH
jgi:hypothetical protein